MRGVAPGVVRRVAVHDEHAAETLGPRPMVEERPAHPGPVALFVKTRERRIPGRGEKRFEVEVRIDAGVDEQELARAPARAQASSQARTRSGSVARAAANSSVEIPGRSSASTNSATVRSPPLASQLSSALIASSPWRRRIEREAHHRLVVAHQRDRFVGADARRGADREIDRAEAVGPAIDEIAEKDDRALSRRLGSRAASRGARRGDRCGRGCRRSRKSPRPGWRRAAARILDARRLRTWNCDLARKGEARALHGGAGAR